MIIGSWPPFVGSDLTSGCVTIAVFLVICSEGTASSNSKLLISGNRSAFISMRENLKPMHARGPAKNVSWLPQTLGID